MGARGGRGLELGALRPPPREFGVRGEGLRRFWGDFGRFWANLSLFGVTPSGLREGAWRAACCGWFCRGDLAGKAARWREGRERRFWGEIRGFWGREINFFGCFCFGSPSPSMGNVWAAGSPPPPLLPVPPPGFAAPPPLSGVGGGAPLPPRPPEGGEPLPNPGAFEECHRRCKELFPVQMEGVKLTVNKGLSNHFQVNHTVALSTLGESNYHFGATYVGTKHLSPTEAFPVLVGDMDNSGSLNAQVVHQVSSRIRSKIAFQTQQSKFVNWQVDGEYRGGDFTAALTLGNPDILMGSGILVAHYLQSVTPALALGAELVYHRRPGEEGAVLSLAGRYSAPSWIGTVTLGQAGAHLTYYHRASEQLQVGVEFEASTRLQDSSVAFGYQLELPRGNLLFRGETAQKWPKIVPKNVLKYPQNSPQIAPKIP
uniref:Translocase of outer mitochondrial membrane 40 n=1 Tax=Taeniopygia guttata TaxID=59729 RepID=A0A674HBB2_TAEGU